MPLEIFANPFVAVDHHQRLAVIKIIYKVKVCRQTINIKAVTNELQFFCHIVVISFFPLYTVGFLWMHALLFFI